jgi:hypothetical protein
MRKKQLLLIILSGFILTSLHSQTYPDTTRASRHELDREISRHFGLNIGAWIPTGDLSVLGTHPNIGIIWGIRHKVHEFNVVLDFRFLKSKDPYEVSRGGTLYSLDNYFGGYLGLDYIFYLGVGKGYDFGILAGLGYDGFTLNKDIVPAPPYEIGSFNFNTGFRFNWYTKGRTYFSFQPKYNIINYANKGGTSFDGNAITLQLFVGTFGGL